MGDGNSWNGPRSTGTMFMGGPRAQARCSHQMGHNANFPESHNERRNLQEIEFWTPEFPLSR